MDQEEESCKVVLLGESGVGKTSIIVQFAEESFLEDQTSTQGATFTNKAITLDNGKNLRFEIWDTAGQEKYRALAKMFYKDAGAAILVYDITRKESFDEIKNYWVEQLKDNAPKKIVIAIAANKSDLYDSECVDEKEARSLAKEIGALFWSTSAKNQEGINELFQAIANKYTDPNWEMGKETEAEAKIMKENKRKTVKIVKEKEVEEEEKKKKKKKNFC